MCLANEDISFKLLIHISTENSRLTSGGSPGVGLLIWRLILFFVENKITADPGKRLSGVL